MRVLAVVNVPPHLEVSGAANAARNLSVALTEFCDIDLVQPAFEARYEVRDGIRITHVAVRNPLSFTGAFLPNRFRTPFYRTDISEIVAHYDLVHLHNPIPALELRRIARACQAAGVPYAVTTHGIVEVAAGGSAYGLGPIGDYAWTKLVAEPFGEVAHGAAAMFALSLADVEILEDMGVPRDRIRVVHNGVELTDRLDSGAIAEVAGRFRLPWPKPDVPVAIFVGNHTRNKGLPILLEALRDTEKPFVFVAAGSKRDHIDYEQAAATGRSDQQVVFTGFVSDHDVAALLQYADLLVFPTLADTFPLAVLEAMAHGLAVLSTTVGGIPHQVPPECGTLIEAANPHALRLAFEEMTADRSVLETMGAAGRRHVEARFTWRAAAGLAYQGYRDLLPTTKG